MDWPCTGVWLWEKVRVVDVGCRGRGCILVALRDLECSLQKICILFSFPRIFISVSLGGLAQTRASCGEGRQSRILQAETSSPGKTYLHQDISLSWSEVTCCFGGYNANDNFSRNCTHNGSLWDCSLCFGNTVCDRLSMFVKITPYECQRWSTKNFSWLF